MSTSDDKTFFFHNVRTLRRLLQNNFVMDLCVISAVSVLHVEYPTLIEADERKGEFHVRDRLSKTLHAIVLRRMDHSQPVEVTVNEHELPGDTMTMTKVVIPTTAFCSIELLMTGHERAFSILEDKHMGVARSEIEGHFLMREAFGPFY